MGERMDENDFPGTLYAHVLMALSNCRCTAFSYLESDPDLAFFGVYDGHGGTGVANYLKDHLHQFIVEQADYRDGNMEEAILKAFLQVRKISTVIRCRNSKAFNDDHGFLFDGLDRRLFFHAFSIFPRDTTSQKTITPSRVSMNNILVPFVYTNALTSSFYNPKDELSFDLSAVAKL